MQLILGSLAAAVVVLVWMSVGGAVLVSSGFEVSVLVNSSVARARQLNSPT